MDRELQDHYINSTLSVSNQGATPWKWEKEEQLISWLLDLTKWRGLLSLIRIDVYDNCGCWVTDKCIRGSQNSLLYILSSATKLLTLEGNEVRVLSSLVLSGWQIAVIFRKLKWRDRRVRRHQINYKLSLSTQCLTSEGWQRCVAYYISSKNSLWGAQGIRSVLTVAGRNGLRGGVLNPWDMGSGGYWF